MCSRWYRGNSSTHQYPKCNLKTCLAGLSLGSTCLQLPQKAEWIQSAKDTMSQLAHEPPAQTRAPGSVPHVVTDMLWHCTCHLITLCLNSHITSGKNCHLSLKSECQQRSTLQFHLPQNLSKPVKLLVNWICSGSCSHYTSQKKRNIGMSNCIWWYRQELMHGHHTAGKLSNFNSKYSCAESWSITLAQKSTCSAMECRTQI